VRTILVGSVLLGLFSAPSHGQQTQRVGLVIEHLGDDAVGTTLTAALKGHVARSALYVSNDNSSFEISLVSMDLGSSEHRSEGNPSAVSVQFSVPSICKDASGAYILDTHSTHSLYIVGRNRTETIAKVILADLGAYRDKQSCS
jgi:hypothetical protein